MLWGPRGLTRKQAHEVALRAQAAKNLYSSSLRSKYKPNDDSVKIIGLQSPTLTHITTDAVPGSLTQTTFDTTSRADSAQILLTNSTGSTKTIIAAWIRGKPVIRLSGTGKYKPTNENVGIWDYGQGIVHDKYVDYEKQAKDGDIVFEVGNNFTVTVDQVNKLGDYYWKLNKTKKHIYTLNLVGFQSWYEPGEWYHLHIGGAGEEEYIDSTVECFDVRCSIQAGGAGWTSISFREVEESWKFDSNEVARMIAAGGFNRRPSQTSVTVAAQYYPGYADYYCDGTDDDEEINDAISYLIDGGSVHLTRGIYNITSSIMMSDNTCLYGENGGTILRVATSEFACVNVQAEPAIPILNNVTIDGITFNSATAITAQYYILTGGGGASTENNNIHITNNYFDGLAWRMISVLGSDAIAVINNVFDGQGTTSATDVYGIYLTASITSYTSIIQSNTIKNLVSASSLTAGIYINTSFGYNTQDSITNNVVSDLKTMITSATCVGVYTVGGGTRINSNRIANIKGMPSSATVYGIYIATGSTQCQLTNNYCSNNGNDAGIVNTGFHYTSNGTSSMVNINSWQ